ncbi:hypothetical protein RRSWK_06709 [Rhodopirellula sp. SWK7]|nr:hypothetical protein RRSWK_06709 [Rhodopirellula sp. SWK7]
MLTPLMFSGRCRQPSAVDRESPTTPSSESFTEPDRWWGWSQGCSITCRSVYRPVTRNWTPIRTKPPVKGLNS